LSEKGEKISVKTPYSLSGEKVHPEYMGKMPLKGGKGENYSKQEQDSRTLMGGKKRKTTNVNQEKIVNL